MKIGKDGSLEDKKRRSCLILQLRSGQVYQTWPDESGDYKRLASKE